MAHESVSSVPETSPLSYIKQISGRRIEDERRRTGLSQGKLAQRVGIGVSWLREIESGNPKARLDDHLRCAYTLGISPSYIFIPLLFIEHGRSFPPQLLLGNLRPLEEQWLEFIIDRNIANIRQILHAPNPSDGDVCGPSRGKFSA